MTYDLTPEESDRLTRGARDVFCGTHHLLPRPRQQWFQVVDFIERERVAPLLARIAELEAAQQEGAPFTCWKVGDSYAYRGGGNGRVLCTDRADTSGEDLPILTLQTDGSILYHNVYGESPLTPHYDLIPPAPEKPGKVWWQVWKEGEEYASRFYPLKPDSDDCHVRRVRVIPEPEE